MAQRDPRKTRRHARHRRVRRLLSGTAQRPRLAVFRSPKHIYAQIIDDTQGVTLTTASSLESDIRAKRDGKHKTDVSKMVGTLIASRAAEDNISSVVFDRGGHTYHGRIKALADAAREGGLGF